MAINELVRNSDPQSSHDAAVAITPKLTMRCKQFLDGLRQLKQATANEVGALVAQDNIGLVGSIRRRASDLHRDGLIRVVGRRNCKVTGKPVTVYEVAGDQGQA